MRQEPVTYAIIGHGRLALHLAWYLHLYQQKVYQWSRSPVKNSFFHESCICVTKLEQIPNSAVRLLAISDDALVSFVTEHQKWLQENHIVHFSGSCEHSRFPVKLNSYHPLFTFTNELYLKETYTQIPFIEESGSLAFKQIFPCWDNPVYPINSKQKLRYHALVCAICNFNSAIIQMALAEMEELGLAIPKDAYMQIARKTIDNAFANPDNCLTGPIARRDTKLIQKQLVELSGSGLDSIYRAILEKFNLNIPDKTEATS